MGVSVGSSIYNAPSSIYESGQGGVVENLPDGYIEIDNIFYPYKKINNRIWTLSNFASTKDLNYNVNLSSSKSVPFAYPIIYNGVKDYNAFTGLLYNFSAVEIIISNYDLKGFRIPNILDFEDLKSTPNLDLKSIFTWDNKNGKNNSLFSAIATGYINDNKSNNIGKTTDFWTSEIESDPVNYWLGDSQDYLIKENNGRDNGFCVRLCKDA